LPNCHVPAEIVMPFIQRYLASYETHGIESGAFNGKRSPAWLLAEAAGISPDTLHKYLNGRTKEINFYVVDRLLCAMDQPMSWYEWPLLPYYLAADLSEPPPGYRVCASPECETEFKGRKGQRHCCEACQQRSWHLANETLKVKLVAKCDGCGEDFHRRSATSVHDGGWKRQAYCTRRCMDKYKSRRIRARKAAA
jgi:hypothetical protein